MFCWFENGVNSIIVTFLKSGRRFLFYRNGNKIGDVQHADYMKATNLKKGEREKNNSNKKTNKTKTKKLFI